MLCGRILLRVICKLIGNILNIVAVAKMFLHKKKLGDVKAEVRFLSSWPLGAAGLHPVLCNFLEEVAKQNTCFFCTTSFPSNFELTLACYVG